MYTDWYTSTVKSNFKVTVSDFIAHLIYMFIIGSLKRKNVGIHLVVEDVTNGDADVMREGGARRRRRRAGMRVTVRARRLRAFPGSACDRRPEISPILYETQ